MINNDPTNFDTMFEGDTDSQSEFTKIITNKKNIDMMSSLRPEEILHLTTAYVFAETFESDLMKNWIKQFLFYRVSEDRKGRGEVIDSYKIDREEQLKQQGNMLGALTK